MNGHLKHVKLIDEIGNRYETDVIEISLGLWSNEAIKVLEYGLSIYDASMLYDTHNRVDGYVHRTDDGELSLWISQMDFSDYTLRSKKGDVALRRLVKKIFSGYTDESFSRKCTIASCRHCDDMMSCCLTIVKDRLICMLWDLRKSHKSMEDGANKLLDFFIDGKADSQIVGSPLDPFRLSGLKALRTELIENCDMTRINEKAYKMRVEYHKLMGKEA